MSEAVPYYEGLESEKNDEDVLLSPMNLVRVDSRFNMMTILNEQDLREHLFAYISKHGGLAHYTVTTDELNEANLNPEAWFPVEVGDLRSKGKVRPRNAATAFASHQEIAEAIESDDAGELVDAYESEMPIEWAQFLPEAGYSILDREFDPANPAITTVGRFFDILNGSALAEGKKDDVLRIMEEVQQKITRMYIHVLAY